LILDNFAGGVAAPTYLALLRGVNVGGKNCLPMRDLAEMFVKAGCSDVQTYIQSGNVLFRGSRATAESVPVRISEQIAAIGCGSATARATAQNAPIGAISRADCCETG